MCTLSIFRNSHIIRIENVDIHYSIENFLSAMFGCKLEVRDMQCQTIYELYNGDEYFGILAVTKEL